MGLFDGMLSDSESLFNNEIALDYDFMPKLIPYRDNEQFQIAACIKPLFQQRNGSNCLVYGNPGVGKTVAIKHVLREIEEQTDEIIPIYVNCWSANSTYKIILEICEALNYKLTMNKNTVELMRIVVEKLNSKGVSSVLVFDEIDKATDLDFLYTLLEKVYRKTIVLITNYKKDVLAMDERIKSRLVPQSIEFKPYNAPEIAGILKQRRDYAFVPGVWDEEAFQKAVAKTAELEDVRKGLYLLREAGNAAEQKSVKKINPEHVDAAITKLDSFSSITGLDGDDDRILELIKNNAKSRIGDLFRMYQKTGGKSSYRTFQRKIDKLERAKQINVEHTKGGEQGNTKIISYSKKLTDY